MINYKILNESINYYTDLGFNRVEAPWTVSEYIDNLTKPEHVQPFKLSHNNKHLVASGEQSFLYLYLKNFLPKGRFQTITPCFRFESFDLTHTKYFMKNELIITDIVNTIELDKIVKDAYNFFCKYLPQDKLNIVGTNNGYDINYKDYELGSYGIREVEFLKYIYGTGVAEPRLSTIINIENGLS